MDCELFDFWNHAIVQPKGMFLVHLETGLVAWRMLGVL